MLVFVLGLLLFFVPHAAPLLLPGLKVAAIAKMGEKGWKGIYSLLSLAGLVLIVIGWMQYRELAPQVYEPPTWGRHVALLFVWIALVLLSVSSRKPGRILVIVKHPMVVGTIYWSLGHLFANGDLASVLLFGSFLAFAIISRITQAIKGDPNHQFVSHRSDAIALGAGTAIYAIIYLWAHVWFTGVALI